MERDRWTLQRSLPMLVVLAAFVWWLCQPSEKYVFITRMGRSRGCASNRAELDRAMSLWESQVGALPPSTSGSITFDTRGRIVAVAGLRLEVGSRAILDILKDERVFSCPACVEPARDLPAQPAPAEVHYRWLISPAPVRLLEGARRGVVCLAHHVSDEDGGERFVHTGR